jgi:hypothetical protein
MFFIEERTSFFKPLNSKYREQIVQCLCLLYQRQYSSLADYGQSMHRNQVIEVFEEALARSEYPTFDDSEDDELPFKSHREHASSILKQLIESGWLEKQVDHASFQSTFPFSRIGRIFSQVLVESDSALIKTRHRNTRNTLNALEAFAQRGEVYDLLDAFDYSERIITDFSDVISELEEQKRQLVKEVERQQLVEKAMDQFFDFMEKRFQPDIQVRLSADSVEKHREDISKVIKRIRNKKKPFKVVAERELRRIVPDLHDVNQSFLIFILDKIEHRMRNAAEIMLPALRKALHGFTKRADIIIRQLSYINAQQNNDLVEICKELSDLPDDEYLQRLENASECMSTLKVQLIDPGQIRLIERKLKQVVDTSVSDAPEMDEETRREMFVTQALEEAFSINNSSVKDYVLSSLRDGKRISTKELPVADAKQLLAMTYAIEVGAASSLSSDFKFKVEPTGNRVKNEYFNEFDEFSIELIEEK